MKKFLIIFLALIIGGVGGYFAYQKYGGSLFHRKVTLKNYKEPFMWAVDVKPAPLANYHISLWKKQMNYVNELGAKWIRLSFDNEPANKFKIFDQMINSANDKGINVFLGLGSTKDVLSIDNTYQDGYQVADEISAHYKGKIKYYQLMSEQGSGASKGWQYSGENESDYVPENYNKIKDWMRGASEAIRKNDPDAYIVITDQWLHTAYIQMLIRDKIDFDIIGWDWYGEMTLMGEKKMADGTLLVDRLKSFDKPIILAEVNFSADTKKGMDEAKQADFIKSMGEWAYNSGYIKGFVFFELVDTKPTKDKPQGFPYGLIKFKMKSNGTYTFGDKRLVFDTYKEIIAKYSK